MDKTKFVRDPQLEGFTENPPGWQEVDGVKLPPITWGEPAKFDGEAGTYSDVRCNTCSPWSLLDQDHLDRIHQIWVNSAEHYRQQLADWYYEAQTEAKL